jgi:hypothetical protein
MKSKIAIASLSIFVLILIFLTISITTFFIFKFITESNLSEEISNCYIEPLEQEMAGCFFSLASKTNEIEICMLINSTSMRDWCIYQITIQEMALKNKRYELSNCDLIETSELKTRCYVDLYMILSKKDPTNCEKMPNSTYSDTCFKVIAYEKGDEKFCEKISSLETSDSCFLDLTGSNKDINLCLRINDPAKRDYCLTYVTKKNEDINICNNITSPESKNSCLVEVAKTTKNVSICYELITALDRPVSEEETLDWCFREVTWSTNNEEYCSLMKNPNNMDSCYIHMARTKKNETICQSVNEESLKEWCYTSVAIEKLDSSVCENINELIEPYNNPESCYASVESNIKNSAP